MRKTNSSLLHAALKHWLLPIFILALVVCLVCDYYLARQIPPNADEVQTYNEVLAVRSGNIFLNHWVLAPDNDYFTDLLPAVGLSFVFGTQSRLVFLVPYIVFCALLVCCLLIVSRACESREQRYFGLFAVLFVLGIPYGPDLNILLLSAVHTGTITLCLYAALIAQPALAGRPLNGFLLVPFSILILFITFSDPMGDIFFCIPLLLTISLRSWLRREFRIDKGKLLICASISIVAGIWLLQFFRHNHGFRISTLYLPENFVATGAALARGIHAAIRGLQILFTACSVVFNGKPLIAATRAVVAVLIGLSCARIIWLMPRRQEPGLPQCLVFGALCLLVADVSSEAFAVAVYDGPGFPYTAVRYLTPIYVFLSVAGILQGQASLHRIQPKAVRFWIYAGAMMLTAPFLAGAARSAANAVRQPVGLASTPSAALSAWLLAHHLTRGYADYWTAGMISAQSKGQILVLPVNYTNGGFFPLLQNTNESLSAKIGFPQFVAFQSSNPYGITSARIGAVYGKPARVFLFSIYTVAQIAWSQ